MHQGALIHILTGGAPWAKPQSYTAWGLGVPRGLPRQGGLGPPCRRGGLGPPWPPRRGPPPGAPRGGGSGGPNYPPRVTVGI